jgi:cation transport ATPase
MSAAHGAANSGKPQGDRARPDVVACDFGESADMRLRAPSATQIAAGCLTGIAAGAGLRLVGRTEAADFAWAAVDAFLLVPLTWSVVRTLLRRDLGVDAIALVSMAGALALGQYLAGAVIALMLAGGNALEERAGGGRDAS